MVRKTAAALALVMFAVCVAAGLGAGNTFSTVLTNALLGMGAALVVGLLVGAMAQKMLDENLAAEAKKQPADRYRPADEAPDAAAAPKAGAKV